MSRTHGLALFRTLDWILGWSNGLDTALYKNIHTIEPLLCLFTLLERYCFYRSIDHFHKMPPFTVHPRILQMINDFVLLRF